MHQAKYTKKSLIHIKLAMRVFFLSVLLMGNTFIFISALASSQTFAQGAAQVQRQHSTILQPQAVVSVKKGLQPEKNTIPQEQKGQTVRQPAHLNSSSKTHARAAGPVPQDVNITSNVQGGPTFQVGQTLHYNLIVLNISSATTLDATSNVSVYGLIPLGLSNITVTGSGWNITITNPTSPTSAASIYAGPPVAPGGVFAPISVSGILTAGSVPVFTNTAAVSDNTNPNTNLTTFSVSVSPSTQTVTATTIPTPTTPTPAIGLDMNFNVHGGPTYQVGQTLTYDLIVVNNTATIVDTTSNAGLGDLVPLGLDNIVTTGSDWTITSTAPNGPFVIRATYSGPPVPPGGNLSPLEISGTLTSDASPTFTNTAGVADTLNPIADVASFSVNVSPATATVIPSPTVTVSSSPTVTVSSSPTVTVSSSPTVTVSSSPTVTVTASPSPTVTPPQLSIVSSSPGGNTSAVGQTVNYQLVVTNLPTSLAKNQPIIVQDVLPVGLTNIAATGNGWSIGVSSTLSPALITATYIGPYPVAPGSVLPALSISGTLTATAGPSFTNAASVSSPDDPNPNPALNTSTQTITVLGGIASPTTTTPSSSPTTTVPPTLLTGATATTVPGIAPNVSIVQSHLGGDHFHVGDTISYVLIVSSTSAVADPISVTDVMPLGLSHMKVVAPGWLISLSDHSSPAVITASYSGISPSAADLVLSPIIITGVLDGDAVPSLTNTATVDTPGNSDVYNTIATDTVFVDDTSTTQNNDDNNNNHQNNNDNNNNHQNNNDNHHQNNNNNNNHHQNNNNSSNSSSNHTSFPGLPATGSDPAGA